MPGSLGRTTVALRSAPTVALSSLLLALSACGKPSAPPVASEIDAPAEASSSTRPPGDAPSGAPSREAQPPDGARDAAPRVSRTQEELVVEAKQRFDKAVAEAKEKKPDCDKVVDLLDISFAMVGPAMVPEDRSTFATFALCATRAQRWRLLRAVTNAIVAGDPAQKTTYFLPRALIGLAQYEAAARLSSVALRLWPKESEAYTTGALASTRIEDWESTKREADQALLVQRQKGLSDEISAEAHIFKAEALLHLGKVDDSSRELDMAKKIKGADADEITKLRETNDVVKSSGLILEADLPGDVPLGLYPFFLKGLASTGGLVTLRVASLSDKPVVVRVEVSFAGVADGIGKSYTIVKGRPQTLRLTPPLSADFKVKGVKEGDKHELSYKVASSEGQVLYQQSRNVTVLPQHELPQALQVHGIDEKLVPELVGIWVTPAAKAVADVVEAAKKRAPSTQFTGTQAQTLPQVKALWDELRERGFSFVRDPSIDSEAKRSCSVRLPADVLASSGGHALEGSVLFASLLEAIGLDVVVVRVPGHAFVGWLPSKSDRAVKESMALAVQSPVGSAFFLETTMVGGAPADAAVLRGAAEIVDAVSKKVFEDGDGSLVRLAAARKLGLAPPADETAPPAHPAPNPP
jgi:tetratricopeptide (TPR) repeat protein